MSAFDKDALVCIRNLSKQYVQRRAFTRTKFTIQAISNINLTIRRGATLALVGESGAGKSTLMRCISRSETPTTGEIWFDGVNLLSLRSKDSLRMRRQIQIIFQDPTSALNPGMTAGEIIAEPLVIQREGTRMHRRARTLELMEQVGLPAESATKLPLEFSGGQRQRLAIARALALEPKLLILDEALSNLDLANQEMILRLLNDLQTMHGLTYIHVSHDLRMVSGLADEIAVMYEGRIVEQKRATQLLVHAEHPYTQDLLDSMRPLERIARECSAQDLL